ncbi:hypothetical protein Hanom_Chr00s024564g01763711 [Helianthus anomalus]
MCYIKSKRVKTNVKIIVQNHTVRACLAKLFEKCLLTYWLFEKSVWSDFLEKSLFPLTYTLIAKHHLELMTFQKANKLTSCYKKLSQTCPKSVTTPLPYSRQRRPNPITAPPHAAPSPSTTKMAYPLRRPKPYNTPPSICSTRTASLIPPSWLVFRLPLRRSLYYMYC